MFNGNMSMPSLSDIAAVTGNDKNNGWGDNGAWWIIMFVLFFAFGGWGNGNGWGNNGNGGATPYSTSAVTQADLQRGFDTQAIVGKLDGLNNGLCDGFYAIKKYAEKVYQKSMDKHWGFLNGVHDNICDMADNLLDARDFNTLKYLNAFVYATLLNENPTVTEGIKTMTDDMNALLLKHLMAEKGGVAV